MIAHRHPGVGPEGQGIAQHGRNIKLVARPGERPRSFDIVGIEFKDLAREMLRYT